MGYADKKCSLCGIVFTPKSGNQLICRSETCILVQKRKQWCAQDERRRKKRITCKKCTACSFEFKTSDTKRKYCGSEECEKLRCYKKNRRADRKRTGKRYDYTQKYYYSSREDILIQKRIKYREDRDYEVKDGHSTSKVSYDKVVDVFKDRGYEVFTPREKYQNTHQKLLLVCPEGHKWNCSYHSFSSVNGNRCYECNKRFFRSKAELEVVEYFLGLGCKVDECRRDILKGNREIDIYFPDQKIGVEYCGLRWHSEDFAGKERKYHRNKMDECISQSIRLITIFEDEYLERPEIVLSRIKNSLGLIDNKIYARKCELKELTPREAAGFLDKYHLQGKSGTKKRWGLFYKESLVQVLTVGSLSRRHAGNSKVLELKRLSSKPGVIVIGGASKLFSVAKKWSIDKGYTSIKSYCDMRWANPFKSIYDTLGFKLERETKYTPHYFKGQKRYRNQALRKTPEERLTGKTEWELRREQGYDRIWDCGHKTYVYDL